MRDERDPTTAASRYCNTCSVLVPRHTTFQGEHNGIHFIASSDQTMELSPAHLPPASTGKTLWEGCGAILVVRIQGLGFREYCITYIQYYGTAICCIALCRKKVRRGHEQGWC